MEQRIKTRQASDFADAVDARIEAATSSVVQPLDATLTALAAITTAADKLIYATGADAFSTTTLTAAARDLLNDVDASAMRTTLGLGTMATAAAADYLPLAGGTMTGNLTISGASLFVGGSYAIAIGDAGNGYYGGWMANTYLALSPNTVFGWNSGDGTTVKDLVLARDAADVLALRRSTNAQTMRVYGTYTDASNFVRASLAATSTAVTLAAETAGTGQDDISIEIKPAGSGYVKIGSPSVYSPPAASVVTTGDFVVTNNGPASGISWAYPGQGVRPVLYISGTNSGTVYLNSVDTGGTIVFQNSSSAEMFRLGYDSTGVLALRNGSNGQKLRVYGDYTGASQYCALEMSCTQTGGDYFSHYIGPVNAGGSDYWNDNRGEIGGWAFLTISAMANASGDAGALFFKAGGYYFANALEGGQNAYFDGRGSTSPGSYGHKNYFSNSNTASHTLGLWQPNGHTKSALTVYTNSVLKADITSAGAFRSYGAWTDDSNYVRASLSAAASSVTLAAQTAGTGADDVDVSINPAGAGRVYFLSNGLQLDSYGTGVRLFGVSYIQNNSAPIRILCGSSDGIAVLDTGGVTIDNPVSPDTVATLKLNARGTQLAPLFNAGGFTVNGTGTFVTFGHQNSASYPALKRSSTELQVRLADDSGYAGINAASYTFSGGASLNYNGSEISSTHRLLSSTGLVSEGYLAIGPWPNYTYLYAAGADIFEQRRTTNAQTLRVYGTYTDGSNYVRASLAATSTSVTLAAETAGTGADNVDVYVTPAGSGLVQLGAGANKARVDQFGQVTASGGGTLTSNTSGSFGAFQVCWGNGEGIGYGGTIFRSGFRLTWSQYGNQAQAGHEDTGLARNAAGVVEVNNGTPGTYRDLRLRTITVDAADGNGLQFNGGGSVEAYSNYLTLTSPYTGFAFYSPQVGANVLIADNVSATFNLNVTVAAAKNFSWTGTGCSLTGVSDLGLNAYSGFVFTTTGGTSRVVGYLENDGTLKLYGAYTDGSNYVRASLGATSTTVTLAAQTAGTGADDINLILSPAGAGKVGIGTASPTQLLSVGSVFKVSSAGAVTIKTGGTGLYGNQGLVADDGSGIALEDGTLRLEQSGAACRTALRNGAIFLGTGLVDSLQYSDSTNQFWLSKPLSFAESNAPIAVYDMIRWGDGTSSNFNNPTYVAVSAVKTTANEYGLTFNVSTAATKSERMRLSPTGFLGIGTTSPTAYLDLPASTTSAASLRIRTGTAPTSPNSGDVWHDSTQNTLSYYAAGVEQTVNGVLFTQTQTVTVADTVTETALTGTGTGTLTLPANFFAAGKTIKIRALGYHSSTASPNITIRVKLGSTTILTTGAIASGNGSDDAWVCDAFFTCRTTGGTGTVIGQGYYEEVHGNGNRGGMVNTATTTIDTTESQAISITVEWGTADAGNTISCTNVLIEVLN